MALPQVVELNVQVEPDHSFDVRATTMDEDGQTVSGSWPIRWEVVTGRATVEPINGRTEEGQAIARVTRTDAAPVLISCRVELEGADDLIGEIQVGGPTLNG